MTTPTNQDELRNLILSVNEDWRFCRHGAVFDTDSDQHVLDEDEAEKLLALIQKREQSKLAQIKANIFTNFKIAMLEQDVSSPAPEGTRFRTPLEELSIILEREIPLQQEEVEDE